MSLYYQLKSNLTSRCVTERYGPTIHRGNMTCCLRAPNSNTSNRVNINGRFVRGFVGIEPLIIVTA